MDWKLADMWRTFDHVDALIGGQFMGIQSMTSSNLQGAIDVDAEIDSAHAKIQLVRYRFFEPPESTLHAVGNFRVELCLSSRHRSSRACFADFWNPHRFERIGDLFLAPPDLAICAKSDEITPLSSIVCQIESPFILSLFEGLPDLTDKMLTASLDIQDAKIRALMLRLAQEAKQPGFASSMLVDSIVTQMAIELFRIGADVREMFAQGGLAPWQLRLIDERLREMKATPKLSEIADLCRISVRQLTRGFRASRNCSIGTYVANSQIEHAKRMLAAGESVAFIANTLGFSSPSNFGAAFRRAIGVTPGEYRRRIVG